MTTNFFKKLFGTTNKVLSVRTPYKDQQYFDKEIERLEEIIHEYTTSPNASFDSFHHWSLAAKRCKLIELKYSKGLPIAEITDDYQKALADYIKGWSKNEATYDDLLWMISMGILLNISDEHFETLQNYTLKTDQNNDSTQWVPDALIWFLINKRLNLLQDSSYKLFLPAVYQQLYQVMDLSGNEAAETLKSYLNGWYQLHEEAPWYNSHLREKGYSGYWAWEAAAIVKLMKLDNEVFKEDSYYPYDMVQWSESN